MAKDIDPPNDSGGSGTPGQPGYVPPTSSDAVLSCVVTGSGATITGDQITGAGGPWPSFRVRVTPLNANGAGPSAEAAYPAT